MKKKKKRRISGLEPTSDHTTALTYSHNYDYIVLLHSHTPTLFSLTSLRSDSPSDFTALSIDRWSYITGPVLIRPRSQNTPMLHTHLHNLIRDYDSDLPSSLTSALSALTSTTLSTTLSTFIPCQSCQPQQPYLDSLHISSLPP